MQHLETSITMEAGMKDTLHTALQWELLGWNGGAKAGLSGPVMENEMLMFVRHISRSVVGRLFALYFKMKVLWQEQSSLSLIKKRMHTHREDSPLDSLIIIIN